LKNFGLNNRLTLFLSGVDLVESNHSHSPLYQRGLNDYGQSYGKMKPVFVMKTRNILCILISTFVFWTCAPEQVGPPGALRMDPGDELFSRAEKMFQSKSYEKALELYNEYLLRFPDRPPAGAALMKIGIIYSVLENFENSRNIFQRLIAEYPDSSFAAEARVEILFTLYRLGRYKAVIKEASALLREELSGAHLLRTFFLLGNTHMAMGSPADALHSYLMALTPSKGEEKNQIIAKLKEAVGHLGSEEIKSMLAGVGDKPPAGYLMYQLGLKHVEEEKYDGAERTLSAFIKRFPLHENVYDAKRLLKEIAEKSIIKQKVIGCLLPLSGPYKTFGNRALSGIELALNRFSSQSASPLIKLIIKDTGAKPERAGRAVQELCNENAAAIIGPIVTAEFAAVEAQDRGIPIITLTQKDKITEIGNYVFRNFITPKMQVQAIVSYAFETLGLKRFAILYPEEKYGTTCMNLFWDEVITSGGKIVGVEAYNTAQTDFADPIKKIVGLYYEIPEDLKETDPGKGTEKNNLAGGEEDDTGIEESQDNTTGGKTGKKEKPEPIVDFEAVFIPDAPNKAGLIIPQLAFYDVEDVVLLGTNLWHSHRLIEMTRQYVQGAIVADGFFVNSASEQIREFVEIFQKTFKGKPGFIESIAYDTAMIMFQMLSLPGIRFKSDLKDQLMNLRNFQGITGPTFFDSGGEAHKKIYLLKIKGDRFVELK